MGWESIAAVGFDLGPLLQGQMRIAQLKSSDKDGKPDSWFLFDL